MHIIEERRSRPKVKRASFDELLEFANKVREAGGGTPIPALMPAVPEDPSQCLIAKNLNFNCLVDSTETNVGYGNYHPWVMRFDDKATRDKVAQKLKLAKRNLDPEETRFGEGPDHIYAVILPAAIGKVAEDFDQTVVDTHCYRGANGWFEYFIRPQYAEFVPYIEHSVREIYRVARKINPDGTVVL